MACATPGTRSAKLVTSHPNRLGWVCGAVIKTPRRDCHPHWRGRCPRWSPWGLRARRGAPSRPGGVFATDGSVGGCGLAAEPPLAALADTLLLARQPAPDVLGAARR